MQQQGDSLSFTQPETSQYELQPAMYQSQQCPPEILNHYLENQTLDRQHHRASRYSLGAERINYYHDISSSNAIDDNHNTISNDRSMNDSNSIHMQTHLPQNGCATSPRPLAVLFLTLVMTSGASALLCAGIMTSEWEFVRWDMTVLRKLANESTHTRDIEWMLNGKVARIPIRGEFSFVTTDTKR